MGLHLIWRSNLKIQLKIIRLFIEISKNILTCSSQVNATFVTEKLVLTITGTLQGSFRICGKQPKNRSR